MGSCSSERRIFANLEDAKQIAGFTAYNSYYLRYVDTTAAGNQAERLTETIADETNYIPQGFWLDNPDDYFLIGEVQEVTSILNTLAIVALVVSGFLVTNVMNTIIVEQKRQIGVMKSIGGHPLGHVHHLRGCGVGLRHYRHDPRRDCWACDRLCDGPGA